MQCENYLLSIESQELPAKYLSYKQVLDRDNILDSKCRLCMSSVEDIGMILDR